MAENIITPVGELNWVFITGQGKKDLNGNDRFCAEVHYHKDSEEFKQIEASIEAFWKENKPKNAKLKSNGIRIVQKKGEDGESEETDMRSVAFWTGITFQDGKTKIVKTYNSKGSEVALGNKSIGNGSRGCISGAMDIYDQGVAARGVTLYLNAIQITKFVEYTQDAGFGDTGEEDGFEGFAEESDGFTAQSEEAKPRL